jgi:hypothetical protein
MRDPGDFEIKRRTPGADPVRQARGQMYGLRSAARFTTEQHSLLASARGNSTLQRFGLGYYSALGKLSAQKNRERRGE